VGLSDVRTPGQCGVDGLQRVMNRGQERTCVFPMLAEFSSKVSVANAGDVRPERSRQAGRTIDRAGGLSWRDCLAKVWS
jgi:hypothetical protein